MCEEKVMVGQRYDMVPGSRIVCRPTVAVQHVDGGDCAASLSPLRAKWVIGLCSRDSVAGNSERYVA